jgi:hypothetical protein
MTDGMITVPTVRRQEQLEEHNDIPEGMDPELAAVVEEQQIINIYGSPPIFLTEFHWMNFRRENLVR